MEPFKSGKEQFLSAAVHEPNEMGCGTKKASNLKGSETTGSQTHDQAQVKKGKNQSQNSSKKYVLDKPIQQTEPEWGEGRTSKDMELESSRVEGSTHKLVLTPGR